MSSVISGISYFNITPINKKDIYSFRQSGGALNFQFENNASLILDTASLRLNCRVRIKQGATAFGGLPDGVESGRFTNGFSTNSKGVAGNPLDNLGDPIGGVASVVNNAEGLINPRVACASVIDSIRISSQSSNIVMEECRNYPRKEASVLSFIRGMGDYCSYENISTGACAGKVSSTSRMLNADMTLSLPLRTGLLNNEQIPLGNVGGLNLNIRLSPDNFVIFGTESANNGGAYYELHDLSLTGRFLTTSSPIAPSKEGFSYSAYSNFNSLLQNSDDNTNLQLALTSVLSVFNNLINVNSLNNYAFDSVATPQILEKSVGGDTNDKKVFMRENIITRNGTKYPYDFSTDERSIVGQASQDFAGLVPLYNYTPIDALRMRIFMDAMNPFYKIRYGLMSSTTEQTGDNEELWNSTATSLQFNNVFPRVLEYTLQENTQNVFGYGVRLDQTNSGMGMDYQNASYSQRVLSTLSTLTDNMLVYTYALSKHKIIATPQGVITSA